MATTQRPYTCYDASSRRKPRARKLWPVLMALGLVVIVAVGIRSVEMEQLPAAVLARLYPIEYQEQIQAAADAYSVDPYLVSAVARAESGFKADAESSAGARGVMQLMPETADWLVQREGYLGPEQPNLERAEDSIHLGTFYLSFLLERFRANEDTALAAYNAGHGVVGRWITEAQAAGETADSDTDMGEIPFPETRRFVERVQHYRELFRKGHPDAFVD